MFTTTIISSLLFFIVTNFGVWISGTMYSLDLQGLIACYVIGFITYSTFLFGALEFSKNKFQTLKI